DAAAEACRRHRAGDGERDRGVVLGQQHLVREDAAGLAEAGGIERLEPFVDEMPDVGAAARTVVADGLSTQVLRPGRFWGAGGSMRHVRLAYSDEEAPAVAFGDGLTAFGFASHRSYLTGDEGTTMRAELIPSSLRRRERGISPP